MKLTEVQRRWQRDALATLLDNRGSFPCSPWLPASVVVLAIRDRANCSPQAATGALRALLTVGLAESCETHRGRYWKATDAAERAEQLLPTQQKDKP